MCGAWCWAQLRKRGVGVSRVLIVGAGDVGRTVIRTVMAQPEFGYRIVALVDDHVDSTTPCRSGRCRRIEGTQRLPQIVAEKNIDEVIVALPWSDHQRILDIFQLCEQPGRARAHRARSLSIEFESRRRGRPGRRAGDRPEGRVDPRRELDREADHGCDRWAAWCC